MRVIIPQEIDLLTTNVTGETAITEWTPPITSTIAAVFITISTGSKSFVTALNAGFLAGMSVLITRTADPDDSMTGTITSYTPSTGEMVVNVTSVTGSGEYSAWTIVTLDNVYEVEDIVKVSSIFPVTIYKSLRSNNYNKFPPDNLEPSIETATSNTSVTIQTLPLITSTSETSLTISAGTKTLTVDAGKDYTSGREIIIARTAGPASSNMTGTVTWHVPGTGIMEVEIASVTGSGTYSEWTVTTDDTTDLRTFTTQTGKNFVSGMMVEISNRITPNSYKMSGEVMSYSFSTGELVVNTFSRTGEGTMGAWSIASQDEIGFWEEVGAANQHKMFDAYVNTKTVFPSLIEFILATDRSNSIALFGLAGIYADVALWNPLYIDEDWGPPSSILPYPPAGLNTRFASSVAISNQGQYLLIGIPTYTHPSGVAEAGQVRIYEKQDTGWVHTGDLDTPEPSFPYRFGSSIDISADFLVLAVGACPIGTTGNDSGKIYIFDRVLGEWVLRNAAVAPSTDDWLMTELGVVITTEDVVPLLSADINDLFGTAVSVSADGSSMIAGASTSSLEGEQVGRVYWLSRYYDQWNRSQTIVSPTPVDGSLFGHSVAISGNGLVMAIGEAKSSTTFTQSGKVHVYDKPSTWWAVRGTLQSADISAYDYFGSGVSLTSNGARLVVGSRGQDDKAANTGKIYIYNWVTSTWVEDETFVPVDGRAGDNYGSSLDIASGGGAIVVGSPLWDTGYQDTGKLYIYEPPVPYWSSREDLLFGSTASVGLSDWFEYFFGQLTVKEDIFMNLGQVPYEGVIKVSIVGETGVDVTCGAVILGRSQDLGCTQFGVSMGMLDFSQRVTDDLGRTTVSQGNWAKTNELDMYLPNYMIDSVYKSVTSLRGIPTAWTGNNEEYPDSYFDSLVVYGIFKDFSITVEGPSHSWCNLSIEGLI